MADRSPSKHIDVAVSRVPAAIRPASEFAIVLCADRKYFPPAYALCLDLARRQPERHDVFILTEAGPHLDRVPHDVPFNILTPDFISRLPNIPGTFDRLTPFGCLRVLVADLFAAYRRVLYLDCDIRVEGSIAPLFRLDLKGAAIAAVDDMMTFSFGIAGERGRSHLRQLGFKSDETYFNSGVLLIDCERWKRDRMTASVIDCMKQLGPTRYLDQDALNLAFRGKWLPLSPRWNFPPTAFQSDIEVAVKPVVYHHIFQKPWKFRESSRRETAIFRRAIENTPYRDYIAKPSLKQIKRLIEGHAKYVIQNATFFLPASRARNRARSRPGERREIAAFILKNVHLRRFADVNQDVTVIDTRALLSLLGGR